MRRAGILLHPTSLPGPYGAGDIGPGAREFAAWLEAAGQRIWQMLPLNPVDGHGSPYASPSAFAGNPFLLSIDDLVADGWLTHSDKPYVAGSERRFEYSKVAAIRQPALDAAAERVADQIDLAAFARAHPWLDDWVTFAAIADELGGDWTQWPDDLRSRDSHALSAARERYAPGLARHAALQWLFRQQWQRLRAETTSRGIELWGDLPIFVSLGSADVWAHQELFRLGSDGRPTVVTGAPPDAFTPTGQKWGHPHYDNAAHAASGFAWWRERFASLFDHVDAVRLDHFRGLEAAWEVDADAVDATGGHWEPGLGAPLLAALRDRMGGQLPIIAEDLGVITPGVQALRDDFGLAGMAILQFAFVGEPDHPYLPHNHRDKLVVYPGTHDNQTTTGWYQGAGEESRDFARRYLSCDGGDIAWDINRAAWRSVADTAIVAMQDALSLDDTARMNTPGEAMGNWGWRMGREGMNMALARRLRAEAEITGRL